MSASIYFSLSNLIFSVFGDTTSHVNFLQWIFGTSLILAIINSIFILIVFYLLLHKEAKSDVKFMWNIHLSVAKKYSDNLRE